MNGQKKQLIAICILFIVCLGAYFGLKIYNDKTSEKEQKQAEQEKITAVSIDNDKITSFSYQLGGKELVFEKEKDTWYYQKDHSISIDQNGITSMLFAVKEVTAVEELKEVENLAEYGLDQSDNVLKFNTKDGEETVTIGMKNEITGQYYLMNSNSDSVYLTGTDLMTTFGKTVEELIVQEEAEKE